LPRRFFACNMDNLAFNDIEDLGAKKAAPIYGVTRSRLSYLF
jgi:hypothetical protein